MTTLEIVKQKDKIPIIDFDFILSANGNEKQRKHSSLLPNNFRCIICGPSNSGKTNIVFNLLFHPNGLRFENVYIFSKTLNQPKYQFLECVLSEIDGVDYHPFTDNEDVPHPNEVLPNSVFIFDDISCERQNNIRNYFTMGRHNNIDSFYLSQTYSSIPKQLMRDNANFIILFHQDERNLRHVYFDHVSPDITFEKFKYICSTAWTSDTCGFLVIDKERKLSGGRYRVGFDTFYKFNRPESYKSICVEDESRRVNKRKQNSHHKRNKKSA